MPPVLRIRIVARSSPALGSTSSSRGGWIYLYRAYFLAPLILTEITSLSLLALSAMVRLSKGTFVSLALMLAVFAIWGMSGFGYPSSPLPITLNVISKILAFGTTLTLFLPQRDAGTGYGLAVSDEAAGAGSGLSAAPLLAATPK